eukprot:Skav204095  [mRNA]  locus=scaffold3129:465696:466793:+ [translate_table: standard]
MLCCCTSNDGAVARSLPAAPRHAEIVIQLKSSDDLQRLDLDLTDPKCLIFASCDGAAAEWNTQNAQQIFPFDRIVKINGKICQAQDIVGISKDTGAVELTLERPLKRLVYLRQTQGGKMGRVAEWNAQMPELAIAPHDRIISINSTDGSPADLLYVLGTAPEEVELEVLHYDFYTENHTF